MIIQLSPTGWIIFYVIGGALGVFFAMYEMAQNVKGDQPSEKEIEFFFIFGLLVFLFWPLVLLMALAREGVIKFVKWTKTRRTWK